MASSRSGRSFPSPELRERLGSMEAAALAGTVFFGESILLAAVLFRVATLVMFSTASLGRATGTLPTWLVVLTYVIGLYELVNVTVDTPTVFLVPAWIALVSVVLLVRHPNRAFRPDRAVADS